MDLTIIRGEGYINKVKRRIHTNLFICSSKVGKTNRQCSEDRGAGTSGHKAGTERVARVGVGKAVLLVMRFLVWVFALQNLTIELCCQGV